MAEIDEKRLYLVFVLAVVGNFVWGLYYVIAFKFAYYAGAAMVLVALIELIRVGVAIELNSKDREEVQRPTVSDGCGCVEVWEQLSEQRAEDRASPSD